jgi:DNA-binding NarL/FixJ family response regulator
MNLIILADNQAIFRAGAARVLAVEDDMRIVAQCNDLPRLSSALDAHHGSVLLLAATLQFDTQQIVAQVRATNSRFVLVAENGVEIPDVLARTLEGVVYRNVTGPDLVNCIRKVAGGQRSVDNSNVTSIVAQDTVGARVRERLTPKELQIVALIIQGCKNKQIATQLHTKEQVIKNYLRSIYDKTGVSDRLELALFTIHHRVLADAAARASDLLHAKSAHPLPNCSKGSLNYINNKPAITNQCDDEIKIHHHFNPHWS